MKRIILLSVFFAAILASCKCGKSSTATAAAPKEKAVAPNTSGDETDLEGTWELVSTIGEQTPFKTLYPNQKPSIVFISRSRQISGNTGCNSFTGSYLLSNSSLSFDNGFALTKMACEGQGETVFIERLKKTANYFIKDQNTLMLMQGDVALLEFKKILGGKSY